LVRRATLPTNTRSAVVIACSTVVGAAQDATAGEAVPTITVSEILNRAEEIAENDRRRRTVISDVLGR
jgi:hypothetical protein